MGNDTQNDTQNTATVNETIKDFGALKVPEDEASNIYCLTVIGQIEGHMLLPPQNKTTKYEHVIPQLVAIEQSSKIKGLLLIMNTVGGDVEAGLAIAEMIATMKKPSVALVLGGGHSIGVPMAVSADYSIIATSATMMIHPIRTNGLIISAPETYEYFEKMQQRVVRFITEHSHISEEDFKELMLNRGELTSDIGTVLVGKEAVDKGLMDAVGGVTDAIEKLNELMSGSDA